jgi:hypothetical protein
MFRKKMAVIWVVEQCSLAEVYRRFRGACYLRHQGALMMEAASTSEKSTALHGATTHKTAVFMLAAVRTWNIICVTQFESGGLLVGIMHRTGSVNAKPIY